MQYQITSDNISLSTSMEKLAIEKFSKLETRFKQFDEDTVEARIVLNSAQGDEEKFLVKGEIFAGKRTYFSDETDYTLESAIITVVDELERMIDRDKPERIKE